MKRITILSSLLLLATQAHAADIEVQQRWTGSYGGIATASEQVIHDQAAWKKLWKELHSNSVSETRFASRILLPPKLLRVAGCPSGVSPVRR